MDITRIIKKPLVTEKGALLKESGNMYVFAVDIDANKIEIRTAVEKMFNVKVKSVNTVIMHGKKRRLGRRIGVKSDWKKAYVLLGKDQKITTLEV